MAAVWGRLAKFSLRTSSSLPRFSWFFGSVVKYKTTENRLAAPVVSCQLCLRRCQSTESGWREVGSEYEGVTFEEREKARAFVKAAKDKSWLWRWLNDVEAIECEIMEEEEYQERQKLIQKMTDMYFDRPSKNWDPAFFEEAFNLFMKYNDRAGCEAFLEIMNEMKVDVNPQFIESVESFLQKSKDESWFKD